MSKKDRETKDLEQKIRELKQENRRLTNMVKRLSKGYYKYLAEELEAVEEGLEETQVKPKIKPKPCWDCASEMKRIEVVGRYFYSCPTCQKRTSVKKIQ